MLARPRLPVLPPDPPRIPTPALGDAPLETLAFAFDFECSRSWDSLAPTADPGVRHCDGCEEPVHFARDVQEAKRHASHRRCISLPIATAVSTRTRSPGLFAQIPGRFRANFAALLRWVGLRPRLPPPLPPEVALRLALFPVRLPPSKTGRPSYVNYEDSPPIVGWLVPIDGAVPGTTIELGAFTLLGTGPLAHVTLTQPGVAQEHCTIVMDHEEFHLRDHGSALGTLVNTVRIVERHTLSDGEVISLAGFRFLFKCSR